MQIPDDRAGLRAVFFDRDGTIVHDVPYNGDPTRVRLVEGAAEGFARLRSAGLRTGIVTNQSGVGRGFITREQADAVTAEVVRQIGGVDVVRTCPHTPTDACRCRKPAPGLVLDAAAALGLRPDEVAVVGDSPTDVEAAEAAGARSVLVPGPQAADLTAALDLLLNPVPVNPVLANPVAAR
jgi:histidinol-phosphate phosphatase family protein